MDLCKSARVLKIWSSEDCNPTTFMLQHQNDTNTQNVWQVIDALYDCKSEVIGPGFFIFKVEIGKKFSFLWGVS